MYYGVILYVKMEKSVFSEANPENVQSSEYQVPFVWYVKLTKHELT